MKATLYNTKGEKKSDIELPKLFETKIREDIVSKYLEAEKFLTMKPYAPSPTAGKRHSASGTISHKRHDFKGHYGRGISRIPRKTMWRRGTNFFWIGAEVTSTRGGRKAHPPRILKRIRKINKKEIQTAMNSALSATTQEKYVLNRYATLEKLETKVPIILESQLENIKSKDLLKLIKTILKDNYRLAVKKKSVRAGKGKSRGRKYKSTSGLLLIKSKSEKIKVSGIDIKNPQTLSITDLYPLGRLVIYTQKALEELGGKDVA